MAPEQGEFTSVSPHFLDYQSATPVPTLVMQAIPPCFLPRVLMIHIRRNTSSEPGLVPRSMSRWRGCQLIEPQSSLVKMHVSGMQRRLRPRLPRRPMLH